MSLANTKQSANITAKASTALISRERSSIRCSSKGALVASMSSWLMPGSCAAPGLFGGRRLGGCEICFGDGGRRLRQRHVDRRQRRRRFRQGGRRRVCRINGWRDGRRTIGRRRSFERPLDVLLHVGEWIDGGEFAD